MKMRLILIVFNLCGIVLGVYQPDINRLVVHGPSEQTQSNGEISSQDINSNAHHSSQIIHKNPTLPSNSANTVSTAEKTYQPREDPRLFYQSPAYLERQNDRKHVNWEVASVYPGREVIHAYERVQPRIRVARERTARLINSNTLGRSTIQCIKCPQNKALIAKPGSNRVYLDSPRMTSCSGHAAPRGVRFIHLYGPRFGSLIGKGTHTVVGKIMQGIEVLKHCKMQITVVTQGCYTPQHLVSDCEGSQCAFSCRDPQLELLGPIELACGSDLKWEGELPICRARTWCDTLPPPSHGRVSCQGSTAGDGLAEGTRCRVRCQRAWRGSRAVAVCRRGLWTQGLTCLEKRHHSSVRH